MDSRCASTRRSLSHHTQSNAPMAAAAAGISHMSGESIKSNYRHFNNSRPDPGPATRNTYPIILPKSMISRLQQRAHHNAHYFGESFCDGERSIVDAALAAVGPLAHQPNHQIGAHAHRERTPIVERR